MQNGRVRIGSLALANRIFVKPLTQHDIQLLLTDDLKNVAHEAEGVFGETWQKLDMARKEVNNCRCAVQSRSPAFQAVCRVYQGSEGRQLGRCGIGTAADPTRRRKNIVRYHRNAIVIQTGDAKYFGL